MLLLLVAGMTTTLAWGCWLNLHDRRGPAGVGTTTTVVDLTADITADPTDATAQAPRRSAGQPENRLQQRRSRSVSSGPVGGDSTLAALAVGGVIAGGAGAAVWVVRRYRNRDTLRRRRSPDSGGDDVVFEVDPPAEPSAPLQGPDPEGELTALELPNTAVAAGTDVTGTDVTGTDVTGTDVTGTDATDSAVMAAPDASPDTPDPGHDVDTFRPRDVDQADASAASLVTPTIEPTNGVPTRSRSAAVPPSTRAVSPPANSSRVLVDRRSSARVAYEQPVLLRWRGHECAGVTVDLSETGVRLRMPQSQLEGVVLPAHTENVRAVLMLAGVARELAAQVRHSVHGEASLELGLSFHTISAQDAARLRAAILSVRIWGTQSQST